MKMRLQDCARRWRSRHMCDISFLCGRARRWRSRRSFGTSFFRGRAHRGKSRRSCGKGFFGGRAHRWRSRRSFCFGFFGGRARRWRSRRSSCSSVFGGRAHRCLPLCILGTRTSPGCEGTSCGSEACSRPWWSARYADALHLLLSCSAALQMHQMSLTVVMETRVGRRQRWHRERHELEAMLAAVIRTRAKLPVQP